MFKDQKIESLIHQELVRQTEGIELIASENYASESVMNASGSILTNKYAEGLPNKRYYGGCKIVDEIEELAIERLKELFGASWAHLGASWNVLTFQNLQDKSTPGRVWGRCTQGSLEQEWLDERQHITSNLQRVVERRKQ